MARTVSPTEYVTVTDPDEPMSSPAYAGTADLAHQRLTPGVYTAHTADGVRVKLAVGETKTNVYGA